MKNKLDPQWVNTRIKMAMIWASILFCFIYADYFELYVPGKLSYMLQGHLGHLGVVDQTKLIGVSVLLIASIVMTTLTVVTSAGLCRTLNIIIPSFFILLTIVSMQHDWYFYTLFGCVEIILLSMLIRLALLWPPEKTEDY